MFTVLMIALLSSVNLPATQRPKPSFEDQIQAEVANFKGKVSIFAKNLDSGKTFAFKADERVRTASTIKVAVMVEAFARVAEGKVSWSDKLVLTREKKVSGSGVLKEMADGLQLTLRDAVTLMMIVSDNTATNLVLEVLTTDAVNARLESLGLKNIKILRKVGSGGESSAGKDPENKRFGLGFATVREMVTLMEKLDKGQVVSAEASKEMIELMKREQGRNSIGRSLPAMSLASKYGALDQLRSAVGILYSDKGRIAIAITCDELPEVKWSVDNSAYLFISRVSELLVRGLAAP